MKRSQRRLHAQIWPFLAFAIAAALIVALVVREHPAPAAERVPVERS